MVAGDLRQPPVLSIKLRVRLDRSGAGLAMRAFWWRRFTGAVRAGDGAIPLGLPVGAGEAAAVTVKGRADGRR